jgi:hypothetical protein
MTTTALDAQDRELKIGDTVYIKAILNKKGELVTDNYKVLVIDKITDIGAGAGAHVFDKCWLEDCQGYKGLAVFSYLIPPEISEGGKDRIKGYLKLQGVFNDE